MVTKGTERINFGKIKEVIEPPNLIEIQTDSYREFLQLGVGPKKRKNQGLQAVFSEVFPIESYDGNIHLEFDSYAINDPKHTWLEALDEGVTYGAALYVTFLLKDQKKAAKEEKVFMGEMPLMTPQGSFVINGAERVVVSQLVRSPGIYFVLERNAISNRSLCSAKLIPSRGAWLEFETSSKDIISVKVDRKRKVSASTFLRALGVADDDAMMALFSDIDTDENHQYMQTTLDKDPVLEPKDLNFKDDDLHSLWDWLHEDKEYNLSLIHI